MIAKRISKNFLSLFSGNIISQAVIFLGFIYIANYLPADQFGRLSFAQAISTFFVRFTEFGLETTAIRRINQRYLHDNIVQNIFFIRIIFSSLIIVIVLLLFTLFFPFSSELQIILITLFSLIGISTSLEWYFQAHEKMVTVGVYRISRSLIFVIPIILFPQIFSDDKSISYLFSFSFIIISLFFISLNLSLFKINKEIFKLENMKELLLESAPIGVAVTLMQIPFNFGTFIVGIVLTNSDVGLYSAAYRPILAIWSFGIIAAYNAFFPAMNLVVGEKNKFGDFVGKLSTILIVAGMFLCLTLYLASPSVINLLYGSKYHGAEIIMRISLITICLVLARSGIEYSLLALKKQREYVIGMIFASVLYIITGVIGAKFFGIKGVVIGALFSEILYTAYIILKFPISDVRWRAIKLLITGIAAVTLSLWVINLLIDNYQFWHIIIIGMIFICIGVLSLIMIRHASLFE